MRQARWWVVLGSDAPAQERSAVGLIRRLRKEVLCGSQDVDASAESKASGVRLRRIELRPAPGDEVDIPLDRSRSAASSIVNPWRTAGRQAWLSFPNSKNGSRPRSAGPPMADPKGPFFWLRASPRAEMGGSYAMATLTTDHTLTAMTRSMPRCRMRGDAPNVKAVPGSTCPMQAWNVTNN